VEEKKEKRKKKERKTKRKPNLLRLLLFSSPSPSSFLALFDGTATD